MLPVPLRVLLGFRPRVPPPALVAVAASTTVFVGTPFLIPAVADTYDVSPALAGLISSAQLLGFVIGSFGAGRLLRPTRPVFVASTLLGVVGSLTAAAAPGFGVLVAARVVIGVALGMAAWFAWQAAFGDGDKTNDIAVVGPLVSVALTPVVATFVDAAGVDWFFAASAAVLCLPLLFARRVTPPTHVGRRRPRHAATPAARLILVALALITLGGSAVFVFAAAIGREIDGMSPALITAAFTMNAIASIPAARWSRRRGPSGLWFAVTGVTAVVVAGVHHPAAVVIGLVVWGFAFFMGMPAAFLLLAERSRYPEERAGDAQAVMALGRVVGPLVGGALFSSGSTLTLGLGAGAVMGVGAAILVGVDRPSFVVDRFPVRTALRDDPAAG